MRNVPWRKRVLFFVPVVLLSGGWHSKQLLLHGHVHWSNHSGYNLFKVWGDFVEEPIQNAFTELPAKYSGYPNINTDLHSEQDKKLSRALVSAVSKRPVAAVLRMAKRMKEFYKPRIDLYQVKPHPFTKFIYRPCVWISALSLWLGFGCADVTAYPKS
jgi:hypothetical protein